MDITLMIWRQDGPQDTGGFETHVMKGIEPSMSLLEVLDLVNEKLLARDEAPIVFDHDCREGICGMCALTVNGIPHGGKGRLTACQLHMHRYADGDTITIEPFRARALPVLRDLAVDRAAMERIQQAGGYITVAPGQAPDANAIPIPRAAADDAFDVAACIGCGACIAACPNGSAMLFAAAKVVHLNNLPQGTVERDRRVLAMVEAMDAAGFGNCSTHGECAAVCPKGIDLTAIAQLNRDYGRAALHRLLGNRI